MKCLVISHVERKAAASPVLVDASVLLRTPLWVLIKAATKSEVNRSTLGGWCKYSLVHVHS